MLYTVHLHCTLYTVTVSLCTVYCVMSPVLYMLQYCTVWTVGISSLHGQGDSDCNQFGAITVDSLQSTVHSTVDSAQYTVQFTVHRTQYS